MSAARSNPVKNEAEISSLCSEIIQRIKTQEDPLALNEYRAFLRKNVPFFMRSYFAAFLLKQLYEAAPRDRSRSQSDRKRRPDPRSEREAAPASQSRREESRREEGSRREDTPRREEAPRRALPDAEAATLFVGVGRNRRAYARDLLAFIVSNAEIDAEAVGELRVLDNFSFVQVRKDVSDSVIESLNGKEFRGRSVSVSYAKPRKEEAKDEVPVEAVPAEDDASGVPQSNE